MEALDVGKVFKVSSVCRSSHGELSETFISISFREIMTISQSLRVTVGGRGHAHFGLSSSNAMVHTIGIWFLVHSDFLTFVLASVS